MRKSVKELRTNNEVASVLFQFVILLFFLFVLFVYYSLLREEASTSS